MWVRAERIANERQISLSAFVREAVQHHVELCEQTKRVLNQSGPETPFQ